MATSPEAIEVTLRTVEDIVLARKRVRSFAQAMGYGLADQTRLATAVSELARNTIQYAGGGWVLASDRSDSQTRVLQIQVSDRGPGIADVTEAMKDGVSSRQGLGIGLPGCARLVDAFRIRSSEEEGTHITLELHAHPSGGTR